MMNILNTLRTVHTVVGQSNPRESNAAHIFGVWSGMEVMHGMCAAIVVHQARVWTAQAVKIVKKPLTRGIT